MIVSSCEPMGSTTIHYFAPGILIMVTEVYKGRNNVLCLKY